MASSDGLKSKPFRRKHAANGRSHSQKHFVQALNRRSFGLCPRTGAEREVFRRKSEEQLVNASAFNYKLIPFNCHPKAVNLIVTSPDKRLAATCHAGGDVFVMAVNGGGKVTHRLRGHSSPVWSLTFHPTRSDLLASGSLAGEVRVWDLKTGCYESFITDDGGAVASLAFHPFNRLLVIACADQLLFWDWEDTKPWHVAKTSQLKERVRYVKFSHDGDYLFTAITNVNPSSTSRRLSESHASSTARSAAADIPVDVMPSNYRSLAYSRQEMVHYRHSLVQRHQDLLNRYNDLLRRFHQLRQEHPDIVGPRDAARHPPGPIPPPTSSDDGLNPPAAPPSFPLNLRSMRNPLPMHADPIIRRARVDTNIGRSQSSMDIVGPDALPVRNDHANANEGSLSPIRLEGLSNPPAYAEQLNRQTLENFERRHQSAMERLLQESRDMARSIDNLDGLRRTLEEELERMREAIERRGGSNVAGQNQEGVRGAESLLNALTRMHSVLSSRNVAAPTPPYLRETRMLAGALTDILRQREDTDVPQQIRPQLSRIRGIFSGIQSVLEQNEEDNANGTGNGRGIDNQRLHDRLLHGIKRLQEVVCLWKSIVFALLNSRKRSAPSSVSSVGESSSTTTLNQDVDDDQPGPSTRRRPSDTSSSDNTPSSSSLRPYENPVPLKKRRYHYSQQNNETQTSEADTPSTSSSQQATSYHPLMNTSSPSIASMTPSSASIGTVDGGNGLPSTSSNPWHSAEPMTTSAESSSAPLQPTEPSSSSDSSINSAYSHYISRRRRSVFLQRHSYNIAAAATAASSTDSNINRNEHPPSSSTSAQSAMSGLRLINRSPQSLRRTIYTSYLASRRNAGSAYGVYRGPARDEISGHIEIRTPNIVQNQLDDFRSFEVPITPIDNPRASQQSARTSGNIRGTIGNPMPIGRPPRIDDDLYVLVPPSENLGLGEHRFRTYARITGLPPQPVQQENNDRFHRAEAQGEPNNNNNNNNNAGGGGGGVEDDGYAHDLHQAVNRAIAGAFIGSGDPAIANNILSMTCRLQYWEIHGGTLPNLTDATTNVLARNIKLHNDASISLSEDGRRLACFVESLQTENPIWADTVLKVISLVPESRGAVWHQKTFGPNAVCVSLSPTGSHVMVGLATRRYLRVQHSPDTFAQIYKVMDENERKTQSQKDGLKLVVNLNRHSRETLGPPMEWQNSMFAARSSTVNALQWLPEPGAGILYGSNKGHFSIIRASQSIPFEDWHPETDLGSEFLGVTLHRSLEVTSIGNRPNDQQQEDASGEGHPTEWATINMNLI